MAELSHDTTSAMHAQRQSPLFQLPGEIRNRIYYYALDMCFIHSSRRSAQSTSAPGSITLQSSTNLLLACKAICREAESLFAELTPVEVDLQVTKRLSRTAKRTLNSFMRVVIQYPVENERRKREGRSSAKVSTRQYGWELYKALELYTRASPNLCQNRDIRRKATVHYGLRWPDCFQFAGAIKRMAKDRYTYWAIEIQYEYYDIGDVAELQELRYIAWARDEVEKLDKRIRFFVTIFHGGPAKRTFTLLEAVLGHRGIDEGELLDSVLVGENWWSVELSL